MPQYILSSNIYCHPILDPREWVCVIYNWGWKVPAFCKDWWQASSSVKVPLTIPAIALSATYAKSMMRNLQSAVSESLSWVQSSAVRAQSEVDRDQVSQSLGDSSVTPSTQLDSVHSPATSWLRNNNNSNNNSHTQTGHWEMWPNAAVVSPWEWSVRRIHWWDLPDQILVLCPVPLLPWPPWWHVRVTTQWHVSQPSPSHESPLRVWRRSAAVSQAVLFAGRI